MLSSLLDSLIVMLCCIDAFISDCQSYSDVCCIDAFISDCQSYSDVVLY